LRDDFLEATKMTKKTFDKLEGIIDDRFVSVQILTSKKAERTFLKKMEQRMAPALKDLIRLWWQRS
jgi:hypothetical protein